MEILGSLSILAPILTAWLFFTVSVVPSEPAFYQKSKCHCSIVLSLLAVHLPSKEYDYKAVQVALENLRGEGWCYQLYKFFRVFLTELLI